MRRSTSRFSIWLIASAAALGGMLFGYDTGVVSGALLFFRTEFDLTSFQQGVVVSMMQLGAVAGARVCGPVSDRWGRRRALSFAAVAFVAGAVLAAIAPGYGILVLARILQGIGVGSAALTVPVYIAEIAPPKFRGALVSLNQLMITAGILVSYLVNSAFAPTGGWRWMFGLAAVPALVLLAALAVLPESPRWLATKGHLDRARTVLTRVTGADSAEHELGEIRAASQRPEAGMRALLGRAVRPALFIGLTLALFQTITGIDTVIYFAPTILDDVGFSAQSATLSTVGIGVVNLAMTVVSLLLLDRIGRRTLLIAGTAVMAVCLALLAFVFSASAPGWLSVTALMAFVGAFAIGLGPAFWLINSEIYPLRLRARAAGLATMMIFGSNAIVSITFLPLVELLGQAQVFLLYLALTIAAVLFMYRWVPETRGRSLEEIEHDLNPGRKTADKPGEPLS
ncbi:sugar porter family MFS transporter [Sciscionella sediminilitoris]|uniref:sugar porter family MFS transporter n=1 Tax=Sciscionella sediminilitoris TaxID=1445613 RepID=UPI000569329F|nr:sugar porter family MFS transporter [Sciscionella sp. SE31]